MSERANTDALVRLADDRFELSRNHVAALGLGTFFFGVLAFLVGLQVGRTGTAEAPAETVTTASFVPQIDEIRELDRLLREVELARSALPPQVVADELPLRFPSALTAVAAPSVPGGSDPALDESAALAPVEGEPARPAIAPPVPGSGWSIQVATTTTLAEAEAVALELREEWPETYAVAVLIDGQNWYRVRVGGFADQVSAQAELARLSDAMPSSEPRLAIAP